MDPIVKILDRKNDYFGQFEHVIELLIVLDCNSWSKTNNSIVNVESKTNQCRQI